MKLLLRKLPHLATPLMDAWVQVPAIVLVPAVVLLSVTGEHASYEHPLLLLVLNCCFVTIVSLAISARIGSSFLVDGKSGLLLLGCGALVWGLGGCVAALAGLLPSRDSGFDANVLISIHNTCAWFSALCHLSGAAISCARQETVPTPRFWLPIAYLTMLVLVVLIALAALWGWMPRFFLPGQGGTMTRQMALGSAIAMFLLAALLLHLIHRQSAAMFAHWYSQALFLYAVGLCAVLLQQTNGSLLSWTGRAAQYLGGIYLLIAAFRTAHIDLPRAVALDRNIAGKGPQFVVALAIAVASVASAAAVRVFFFHDLGGSMSYVTFFPAVMFAAFLGGFVPGLLTTVLSPLLVFLFWTEPFDRFVAPGRGDWGEAVLFVGSGLLITLAARAMHQAQARATLAEAEVRQGAERARAAEVLRISEERLAYVIEGTGAGIWDWNVSTGEVVFNERWAEIAGYTLAELSPLSIQTWLDLVHPDDLVRSNEQLAEIFARKRSSYDVECRMKHRNGDWVWIQDKGKVIEWSEGGQPLRMTGSHIDITARKRAEEQLTSVSRELRIILETVPIGIAKVIDRTVVWSNNGMEELLHYSREELLHRSTALLYTSQENFDELGLAAYPLLADGGVFKSEQRLLRKDGIPVCVKLTGRAIEPADLSLGSIWALEDITERKLVEEAVQERAELFQALFERNQAVQLLADPADGAVIDANAAAVDYYGYTLDQLQSQTLADISMSSPVELQAAMDRPERLGSPLQFRHRLAAGAIRDVEVFASPIKIAGRTLLHSIVHDVTERKRLDAALRENQALLRAIVDGTSDAVYIRDWAGRHVMCNRAMGQFLDRPSPAILGTTVEALVTSEEARQVMDHDRQVLEGGEVLTVEEHFVLNGIPRIFLTTKGPVRNAQGSIIGLFGIARDITERKQLEERLRERENNLRNLVETTSDLIVVATVQGRILFSNPQFRHTLGYERDELEALHLLELHPPNLRLEAERIFSDLLQGARDNCPLPLMTSEGVLVPVETRARRGTWNGQACVFGFIKDLSAEQEAQQRFERLFHRNPAPMALTGLSDRRFLDVNDAFQTTTGYDLREVVGRTSKELGLFKIQSEEMEALVQTAVAQGSFFGVELQVTSKDGRVIDGLFSGEVVSSQGREYLLTVMLDITERKRMERELQKSRETAIAADKAKSTLLSTVAHEFRTPLSLLTSSLDILDRYSDRLTEAQRTQQNRHIRNATRQLASLADTVLTYRTLENEALRTMSQPCDFGDLCRTIAEEIQVAWGEGRTFRISVSPQCGILLLDEKLFRRVLGNLLANAFQYTPPGRAVTLEVCTDGPIVRVVVADQGIGMVAEDLPHVFDPFYRGRNVGQHRGMGLGLSIVRETLEQMGGSVALASTIGVGTTVEVLLPLSEDSPIQK